MPQSDSSQVNHLVPSVITAKQRMRSLAPENPVAALMRSAVFEAIGSVQHRRWGADVWRKADKRKLAAVRGS